MRWVPVGLFAVEFLALTWLSMLDETPVPLLFLGYGVAFGAFAALILLTRRKRVVPWFWFLGALVLRVPWLAQGPTLSDDVWRYLHDGRAQVAGVNPYRYSPDSPEASLYAGPEHALVNHPELPTIYPPAAQLAFRSAIHLGGTLLSWKTLLVVVDLALGLVLVRLLAGWGLPQGGAVVYLFHPLPILEFAGNGHLDALGALPLMVALWMAGRRDWVAGAALAVSVAVKYLAAPLAPFFARASGGGKYWVPMVAAAIALVLLYLPFLDHPPFGSLGVFARSFEFNGPIYSILAVVAPKSAVRAVLAVALVLVLAYAWLRELEVERASFAWVAAVLLLSPIVHPWYTTWLIPFLALRMRWWALVWTGTVILPYWVLTDWRASETWHLPGWVMVAEYLPVYAVLIYETHRDRRRVGETARARSP